MARDNNNRLHGEFASAALRALQVSYRDLNYSLFGGALRPPVLKLSDSSKLRLGTWDPDARCIEISSQLLLDRGWGSAIEILKHEMAHQFVHEVLAELTQPPHGAAFRKICRERGIDFRAAAAPGDGDAQRPVLDRIRKLLSLAQSPNEHEAQSATRIAQRLMLRHNIDQLNIERDDGYTHRQIGRVTGRVSDAESMLSTILQEHFFVDVIWVYAYRPLDKKYGRVIEVCGRSENIELADYVYDFLIRTAEHLWREHKKAIGISSNRDRRAFAAGVMSGFREQLDSQQKEQISSGLIWLGDPGLDHYFKCRHPKIRTTTRYEKPSDPARARGHDVGRKIVLHRGLSTSKRQGTPKLLGTQS